MADGSASPAPVGVRKLEPHDGEDDAAALNALAALHRRCLPWTASSRAGITAVATLYRSLVHDPAACVLVTSLVEPGGDGGFSSGTTDLRSTERGIQRCLRSAPGTLARLAALNLLSPGHILARRAWERVIPAAGVGYVLTIGATTGSPVRGGDLLRALELEFLRRGMSASWVDTERANDRAVRFYERSGYAVVSVKFGQVLLRRELNP